jgi:hypothetical protein
LEERPVNGRPGGSGPRVGLWGPFDVECLGAALYPRVVRSELARRLPDALVRAYAPLGHLRPTRFDGGEPAEPLGAFVDERRRALAAELDCVVVGGLDLSELGDQGALMERYGARAEEVRSGGSVRFLVEGLGADLERRCSLFWHAVEVSAPLPPEDAVIVREAARGRPLPIARDEGSRERLRSAGIGPGIVVGPDPAVLASRVFDPALLRRRLAWLRFMGWYPAEREAVVVQGGRSDVGSAARIAAAVPRWSRPAPALRWCSSP